MVHIIKLLLISLFFSFSIYAESNVIEPTTNKHITKKWGYIISSSLPKFPKEYLESISKDYEILCINGLELNGKGQLRYTSQFIDKIAKSKLKSTETSRGIIYPMITVSTIREGIELLNSEKAIRKAKEHISDFVIENGFKGIHLDIEYLPPEFDIKLAEFLNQLKIGLKEKNIKVTFAVFPQIDFPANTSKLHNFEKLVNSVDEVVLMSYDLHNKKTEAGCVTSLEWTKKNLNHILKYFKPEQVWLGMPAYGYEWILESKKVNVVSARDGDIYKKTWETKRENSGCIKILKEDKKKTSLIYFADDETRNKMIEIAEEYKIRGTSVWRLGLEDNED